MALAAVMAIMKWSISSVGPTVLSRRVAAYPLRAGVQRLRFCQHTIHSALVWTRRVPLTGEEPPLAQNTSITNCLADQGRGRDHNSHHFLPERTIGLSYSGAAANIPPINKMNPRANERSSG